MRVARYPSAHRGYASGYGVFLRVFGARLCYWGQPRPPSTLLWLSVSLRPPPLLATRSLRLRYPFPFSLPRSLSPSSAQPHHSLTPHPGTLTVTQSFSIFLPLARVSPFFTPDVVLHLSLSSLSSLSLSLLSLSLSFLCRTPESLLSSDGFLYALSSSLSIHFFRRVRRPALSSIVAQLHYNTFSLVSSFILLPSLGRGPSTVSLRRL